MAKYFNSYHIFEDSIWIYKIFIDKYKLITRSNKRLDKSVIGRYFLSIKSLIKNFINSFKLRNPNISDNIDTLLYINSHNTYQTLQFLENIESALFFEQVGSLKTKENSHEHHYVFNFRVNFWQILFTIPSFVIFSLFFYPKILLYPNLFFENWIKLNANIRFLADNKHISRVIFANDHNVNNRIFLHAAKKLDIETILIPHTPATINFPPLIFDLSLLVGNHDIDIYREKSALSGKVMAVGKPSYDRLYKVRMKRPNSKNIVGISVNLIDEKELVYKLVANLLSFQSVGGIIIRLHPRDNRNLDFDTDMVTITQGRNESIDTYFSSINFHLAGSSTIHIEAIYSNTPSFYIQLYSGKLIDNFNYCKNGLIDVVNFDNISIIFDTTFTKDYYKKAEHYVASINKHYDGEVGDYIKNLLIS